MSAAAQKKAEIDVAEEQRRIDSALDAGLPHASERFTACYTCGATPGIPCLNQGLGEGIRNSPHRRRIDDYFKHGPAISQAEYDRQASTALTTAAPVPTASEIAHRGLQQAIKAQILTLAAAQAPASALQAGVSGALILVGPDFECNA